MKITSLLFPLVCVSLAILDVKSAPISPSPNTDITKPLIDTAQEKLVFNAWDGDLKSNIKGIKSHVLGTAKERSSTAGRHLTSSWFPKNPFNQGTYDSLVKDGYILKSSQDMSTFLAQVPFKEDGPLRSPVPKKTQARQSGAAKKPKVPEVRTKTLFMDAGSPEAAFKGQWKSTDVENACKAAMRASIIINEGSLKPSAGASNVPTGFSVPTPFGQNICVRLIGSLQRISSCFPLSIHPTKAETGALCTEDSAFDKLFLQRKLNSAAAASAGLDKQTNGPSNSAQPPAPAAASDQAVAKQDSATDSTSSTGSDKTSSGAPSTPATQPPQAASQPVKPPVPGAASSSGDAKVPVVAVKPAKPRPKPVPKPAAKSPAQGASSSGNTKAPATVAKPVIKPAKPVSKPKSAKAGSKIVKVRRGGPVDVARV